MQHQMLIESDPYETRVAVLEDSRLSEVFVERHRRRGLVGNIYKGRVTRVLAGMQAAFLDIGLERDAFLYVTDAQPTVSRVEAESGVELPDEGVEAGAMKQRRAPIPIQDLVSEGQKLLVQVAKDPLPRKGARVSIQIAPPARFLVLLPGAGKSAVSRRIEVGAERQRLMDLIASLDEKHGMIVRTAGEGRGEAEFVEDHRYLTELWEEIEATANQSSAPQLVHSDLEPALRMVRDLASDSFQEITVQGSLTFRKVATFFERVQPALADRVREFSGDQLLFDAYGVNKQIDAALRSKVWLKSGGYLVINPTEALVAIDVNTGRFVGKSDLEETVFKTNMEAARELARQIRLRDLGGIIVVDFIDMERPENGTAVLEELQAELSRDRSRNKVLSLSDFGLVEITRKRSRSNLRGVLTEACPDCQGRGRVKSPTTVCLAIRREIIRQATSFVDREPLIVVHPAVEEALQSIEHEILVDIEQLLGKKANLRGDATLHREQFEVLPV